MRGGAKEDGRNQVFLTVIVVVVVDCSIEVLLGQYGQYSGICLVPNMASR